MAHRPRPKNKGNAKKYNAQMQQWKTEHKAQKERTRKRLTTAVVNPKGTDDDDKRTLQKVEFAKGIEARRKRWMQQPAPWGRYDNGQPKPQPSATEQLKNREDLKEMSLKETGSSGDSEKVKELQIKPEKENNKTKEPKISERQQRIKKLEELSKTDRNYIPTSMDVESGATGGAKTWKQCQQYKKYQRMLRKLREDEKKGG